MATSSKLHGLVFSYLLHHCHGESAAAVQTALGSCKTLPPVDVARVRSRRDACNLIRSGRIGQVFASVPGLADNKHAELRQSLRYQQFIELIREKRIDGADGALEFAREWFNSADADPREQDLITLLAYEHPEDSPLAYWMDPKRRDHLADEVNASMLREEGLCSMDPLRQLTQHLTVIMNTNGYDEEDEEEDEWSLSTFMSSHKSEDTGVEQKTRRTPSRDGTDTMCVADVD